MPVSARARMCASAHPLSPLEPPARMRLSVENMCVSEGVREGEKLSGISHVDTSEPRRGFAAFSSGAASTELRFQ